MNGQILSESLEAIERRIKVMQRLSRHDFLNNWRSVTTLDMKAILDERRPQSKLNACDRYFVGYPDLGLKLALAPVASLKGSELTSLFD